MTETIDSFDREMYEVCVKLCLESNSDQPKYDRVSAMAAVDSMLTEESGNYRSVWARLSGQPSW